MSIQESVASNPIIATYTKAGQSDVIFYDVTKTTNYDGVRNVEVCQGPGKSRCTKTAMTALIAKMEKLGFTKKQ